MKTHTHHWIRSGFTLMETVIAIGVIAVLITGFIAVFAPAVDGIRRSISAEEANRLASTLERELVTLRQGQAPSGATSSFEKAFEWVRDSGDSDTALVVYQYRGDISARRADDTPQTYSGVEGVAGTDFVTVSMVRRITDPILFEDMQALEGRAYIVRCIQLVDQTGTLVRGQAGVIVDPKNPGGPLMDASDYSEAVLTFAADFHSLPSRSPDYLQGTAFSSYFSDRMGRPIFTRNLAVRR